MLIRNVLIVILCVAPLAAQTMLSIVLPERTRLLEDQRIDLVIEARNFSGGVLRVTANGKDMSSLFSAPNDRQSGLQRHARRSFSRRLGQFPQRR